MQRSLVALSPTLLENLKNLFIFRNISDQVFTDCLQKVEELHLLKNELVFRSGESYHKGIYFVLTGTVIMTSEAEEMHVGAGDAVGLSTFLGKTMYTVTALAESDSDIIFIDEYSIYNLMEKAPGFRERFMKVTVDRLNNLERMLTRTMSLSAYQSVGTCMSSPLITLHNSKSVAEAGKMMKQHNIGALVIMNRKHVLKGLLTAKHLAHGYLSNSAESPTNVLAEDYANTSPLLLPQEYPLVETLSEMLRRGEDYAIITRKNRPAGIISKSDIMALLSNGSDVFGATVSKTSTMEELNKIIKSLPKIIENMMNNTSLFRELLPTISTKHILIQKRVFELAKQEYRKKHSFELFAGHFCFLSLDNTARRELSLKLQQNHALVLSEKVTESERKHYIAFAKLFSEMLAQLGYEYDPMGISINNPEMVKNLDEWREFISYHIHKSGETNIPYSRMIFDCEKFEGDELLAWEFKDAIYNTVKEKALFFGRLMNYQSVAKIPISQFGSFIVDKDGEFNNTIDLKENAFDFVTYTAQAFSISSDILDTNSIRRIDHLGRKKIISGDLVREVISAYESLVDLLLHEQINQIQAGQPVSFRIKPSKLSMHSQELLKRALHIIARFFGEGLAFFR